MKNIVLFAVLFLAPNLTFAQSATLNKVLAGTDTTTHANFTADSTGPQVDVPANGINFAFCMDADYTAGSTMDAKVQYSPNGVIWKDLVTFTQVTTSDFEECVHINKSTTSVLKYVRYVVDVDAGSPDYDVLILMSYGLKK